MSDNPSDSNSRREDVPVFPSPWNPLDPLPEYTLSWGPHLRRPSTLPDDYDTRIDPAHIFVFSKHPVTGIEKETYVTPKPCDYCAKIRQVCSRSRPFCQRCAVAADPERTCIVEEGWVKLPGPKCKKLKLRVSRTAPDEEVYPNGSNGSTARRTRAIAPVPQQDPGPSVRKFEALSASVQRDPPNKRARMGRADSPNGATGVTPPRKAGAKLSSAADKKRHVSQRGTALRSRRSGRRLRSFGNDLPPGSWQAPDDTVWRVIRPPSVPVDQGNGLSTLLNGSLTEDKPDPPHRPRIWAASKSELLAVLPELSRALDANGSGIFKEDMALEPPQIFLERSAWPGDRWESDGVLRLSIECEFIIPPGRGQNAEGVSVDYQDDGSTEMTLEEIPNALDTSVEDAIESEVQSRPVACHPSELLRGKRAEMRAVTSPHSLSSNMMPNSYALSPPPTLGSFTKRAQAKQYRRLTGAFGLQIPQVIAPPTFSMAIPDTTSAHPLFQSLRPQQNGAPGMESRCTSVAPSPTGVAPGRRASSGPRLRPATFDPPTRSASPLVSSDDSDSDDEGNIAPRLASLSHSPSGSLVVREANERLRDVSQRLSSAVDMSLNILPPQHAARNQIKHEMRDIDIHLANVKPRAHVTKWNRPATLPRDLPPEIQRLQECKTYGIPVSIVISRDSALLPFSLSKEFGVVYLGFFKIQECQHNILSSEIHPDGSLTARVRWQHKLVWIPGGDYVPEGQLQPPQPWWLHAAPDSDVTEPSPYSLLPMQLSSDFARFAGHHGSVASEVNTRLGWHCTTCGRLNVQKQLCFQQCSTCSAGNGMTAVGAMYVRDPHRMTPDSRPIDTYPDGVACSTFETEQDGRRTFVYTIKDKVQLKHIFTCNRSTVQKPANQLFIDLQMQVPLAWQEAKTQLASGPYFTYLAGSGHEGGASATPWNKVPECIASIRKTMQSLVVSEGREKGFRVDQMTVISWHAAGNRKSIPFPAKNTTIALMCLGADVELSITPRGGFRDPRDSSPAANGHPVDEGDCGALDVAMDEAEIVETTDSEDDTPLALKRAGMIPPAASITTSVAKASRKRAEAMFITLVHGDILILMGDDFEYSLHRTGMGILLIGMPSSQRSRSPSYR